MLFSSLNIIITQRVFAASPPSVATPEGLSVAHIKITGTEYILLINNSAAAIPDLSRYWLYGFNNMNPLAANVNSTTQQLPAVPLQPGQTLLLNSGGLTCGAAVVAKLAISLTDSGGFLQIIEGTMSNNKLLQVAGDSVSWSSGVNSTAGMITNVPSAATNPNGVFYRYANPNTSASTGYLWQAAEVDTSNQCQLNVKIAGVTSPGPTVTGTPFSIGLPPPATYVDGATVDVSGNAAVLPAADVGLAAPIITELLPNPAQPLTDAEDEFVELYNPNDKPFELTGFVLSVGTTRAYTYNFPKGVLIPAKSFMAFLSVDTGLAMSNTAGQARLIDPFGNTISQTDVYESAKEGQSWALADTTWHWTTVATPGAANTISLPSAKSTSTKAAGSSQNPPTKAAATQQKQQSQQGVVGTTAATIKKNPHWAILAGVALLAVLYACYEYRYDVADYIYRFRRNRAAGTVTGSLTQTTNAG